MWSLAEIFSPNNDLGVPENYLTWHTKIFG